MNLCEIDAEQPATTGHLCPTHADDLHMLITRIPDLITELDTTITRQSAQIRGVTGGGDGDAAMPFHVGASITRTKLVGHLAGLVAAAGRTTRDLTPTGQALTALRALPTIAAHPLIGELYTGLSGLIIEATNMIDVQDAGIVVGECDCQPSGYKQPLLVATGMAQVVDCPACQSRWYVPELIAARQDRVDEARNERMPVTQAAKYLQAMGYRIQYEALSKRCQRGALDAEGGLRLGDAMDLLEAEGKGPALDRTPNVR